MVTTKLEKGMDFRLPEYRREVFLRFYEFHLKYRSHPGGVYYLMPFLSDKEGWNLEERLWFAYINGNTQNPVTSYLIFTRFPSLGNLDIDKLSNWFNKPTVYRSLQWDTDRRHHKTVFMDSVRNYKELTAGRTQEEFFRGLYTGSPGANFASIWSVVSKKFFSFGRLSTFSYLEYLRIMGLDLDCNHLFLEDMEGSKSHRNGLCKVIGRDDLDWHSSNPGFNGKYAPGVLTELAGVGESLLDESLRRAIGKDWEYDVSYFTLESALCTYKSWHRKNRRYPNVYNDMLHDRIVNAESRWLRPKLDVFWEARQDVLPANLRLEDNPLDVGCKPIKQNHYRLSGQVIMMERDWDCFENDYSNGYITA